jgi:hypothetical protein
MDENLHEKLMQVNEQENDILAGLSTAARIGSAFWGILESYRSQVKELSDEAVVQLKADLKSRVIEYIEDEDGQWLQA